MPKAKTKAEGFKGGGNRAAATKIGDELRVTIRLRGEWAGARIDLRKRTIAYVQFNSKKQAVQFGDSFLGDWLDSLA